MSATLPNISDLSVWLDASLYVTTYRPVDLSVLISFDNMLYTVNGPRENESNTGKVDAPLWGNNLPHGAVPNGVLFYPIWGTMLTVTLFMFMVTLFLLTVTVVSMFRTSHHGYV